MPKDIITDAKIEAVAGKPVELPNGQFVANAEMTRDGMDLHLTTPDGHTIIVEGYFAQAPIPDLITPDGARLTSQLVDSFLPPERAGQYADSGQIANDVSPAGKITEVVGEATIVRADGTRVPATEGTPVFQGDVIETAKTGAVNILFADNTSFAISENARLSVDQFVYNASEQSGSTFFSMLQGVFVYTSGLVGKNDPGSVNIETPVGSIGIRGTVIAGQIMPAGQESNITILDGAITLTNGTGTQELNTSFQTLSLTGYQSQPVTTQMDAQTFSATYDSLSAVAGDTVSHYSGTAPDSNTTTTAPADSDTAPQEPSSGESTPPASESTAPATAPDATTPAKEGSLTPTNETTMISETAPAESSTETALPETTTATIAEPVITTTVMTAPPPPTSDFSGTSTGTFTDSTKTSFSDTSTTTVSGTTTTTTTVAPPPPPPSTTTAQLLPPPDSTTTTTNTIAPPPPSLRFNFAPLYLNGTAATFDDGVALLGGGLNIPAGGLAVGKIMVEGFSTAPVINITGAFTGTVLQPNTTTTTNPYDTIQVANQPVFAYDAATKELRLLNPTAMLENLNPNGTFNFTVTATVDGTVVMTHTFTVFTVPALTAGGPINVFVGDPVTGVPSDDVIIGTNANDLMIGREGNDTVSYATATNAVMVNLGNTGAQNTGDGFDTLLGFENLTGSGFNDMLSGNTFANIIDGGAGADSMAGGAGNDTYIVDNVGDAAMENAGEGIDNVRSSVSFTLNPNVENLTLTGGAALNGTGNALNNIITGNTGNNVIDGGAGNDIMTGGGGTDTVSYASAISGVTVNLSATAAQNTINAGMDTLSGFINLTGSNFNDILTGDIYSNTINGGMGNDTLDGGLGVDTLYGGMGNDTYLVDDSGDITIENPGEGIDTVNANVNYTLTDVDIENLSLFGTGNLSGTGNVQNNNIIGNSGDNTIDGMAGADMMQGGAGNDTYFVESAGDVVNEMFNEGTQDTVYASINYTLTNNVERLNLTGLATSAMGNSLDNVITGTSADNIIDGGIGIDTMIGGIGNDTYFVDNAGDVVTENSGGGMDTVNANVTYTLANEVETLYLTGNANINAFGNALNNTIYGNVGNNILNGGLGVDIMWGGMADDIYYIDEAGDVANENVGEGNDTVKSTLGTYALTAEIENLILMGTNNISGMGNNLDNYITGNTGDNAIDGGLGRDTMQGGAGNDTYNVDDAFDIVSEGNGLGNDTVNASVNHTLSLNVENLNLLGASNISGTGNALNNTIIGNSGNNVIDGGAGADTMSGGAGDDTYVVDSTFDSVTEGVGQGIDTVNSNITYTLAADIEHLTLTGLTNIDGVGNAYDNIMNGNNYNNVLNGLGGNDTIYGGMGNDTINGGAGNDVIDGGAGIDTITYAAAAGPVTANLQTSAAGGGDGADTISNIENIIGSTFNDTFTGNQYDNIIDGGLGIDTLSFASLGAGNGVNVNLSIAGAQSTGLAAQGMDTYISIENITGSNFDDFLKGDNASNTISGGGGNDKIEGGDGNDSLIGGTGINTVSYFSATGGVTVNLTGGSGNASGAAGNDTLAQFQDIEGSNFDDTLNGDTSVNKIFGNGGNDLIFGGGGADDLTGGMGNDTFVLKNQADVAPLFSIFGGQGMDILQLGDASMAKQNFDFRSTDNIHNIERIELSNSNTNNGQNIFLNIRDVFEMSGGSDTPFTLTIGRSLSNTGGLSTINIDNSDAGLNDFTIQSGTVGGGMITYSGTYSGQLVTLVIEQGPNPSTNGIQVAIV